MKTKSLENFFRDFLDKVEREEEEARKRCERRILESLKEMNVSSPPDTVEDREPIFDEFKGYRTVLIKDEYGGVSPTYRRIKGEIERIQSRIRAGIEHPGDMKITKNGKTLIIPNYFFRRNGEIKPSKKIEYLFLLKFLEK